MPTSRITTYLTLPDGTLLDVDRDARGEKVGRVVITLRRPGWEATGPVTLPLEPSAALEIARALVGPLDELLRLTAPPYAQGQIRTRLHDDED